MPVLVLPKPDKTLETLELSAPPDLNIEPAAFSRTIYAAAHVVADPLKDNNPWIDASIDWDQTIAFREYLWEKGLGVAEAMDTAQRGMGLDWDTSRELIRLSLDAAKGCNGLIACGAGTDHLSPKPDLTVNEVIQAYEEQCETVERFGGRIILMASRALTACARGSEDFSAVYTKILNQVSEPVIIHWLGDMFDPKLKGYWGSADIDQAMETCLSILNANSAKIDGIKISLLSKEKEILMRRRLPEKIKMYTGDDFNYPELILGDKEGHSHALLGIFDAIAGLAAAAATALGKEDNLTYNDLLEPTVPLSRHIFKAPTRFYKTGVVFLAYLNGFQKNFTMLGGQESTRSTLHLADLIRLANSAGALLDPELAASRAKTVFASRGIGS